MHVVRRIAFVFIIVPAAKIAVFVLVAAIVGFLNALLATVLTSLAGALMLRRVDKPQLRRFRASIDSATTVAGTFGSYDFVNIIAGFLLLLPGFITDVMGFLVLLPRSADGPDWRLDAGCAAAKTPLRMTSSISIPGNGVATTIGGCQTAVSATHRIEQ
jgi:UPF0716 protein FxsA